MIQIKRRFFAGSLGEIVALHGRHYATHWGFGTFFESKVAREIAEFQSRMCENDMVLIAHDDDGVAASIVLDLNDPASGARGAHLRWFIVADRCRGTGIGRRLLSNAMGHADVQSNGCVWLTTFEGLAPARYLYESFGFALVSQKDGQAWGTPVVEQEFRRPQTEDRAI